ncbi:leucine-rich repeat domain-containing protein [Pseudomonas sp. HS6]|uniref:leucine-rich repeat domain-containing protein n=1 Tax=Pseudomonas sp. HS6 TaxID=2850559 RepID=UPI002018988A|nr:leucine-rich repeat domain-containing protein [Pseudomonas sp. HS6]UQS16074.1 leucine-rich repeat domain-containing protein [Pseudomonas sp. HS6]
MSEVSPPDATTARTEHRHITRSIHAALLEQSIPDWLTEATSQRRQAMKRTGGALPDWYRKASKQQRKHVHDSYVESFRAQTRLDKTLAGLHDIHTFAKPLLTGLLKERFNVELDVDNTFLQLIQSIRAGIRSTEIGQFEFSKMSLLQAALHNFEASECEAGAFHELSGFLIKSQEPGLLEHIRPAMTVSRFMSACRALDIGGQYQRYLKDFLYARSPEAQQLLREQFIAARKTALRAAAEQALLRKDIEPVDYTSILAIIAGALQPRQGNRRLWFCELSLMRRRLTGCLWLAIGMRHEIPEHQILYIPDDPHHPLKRYRADEVEPMFKQRFTARDGASAEDGRPTVYQRFFSRFMAYADRPYYFSQFTRDASDARFKNKSASWLARVNAWINGMSPLPNTLVDNVPAAPKINQEPEGDPFLAPVNMPFKGLGFWDDNIDPWDYLFTRHCEQMIEDARHYAVPAADVDAAARKTMLSKLLSIGMFALNTVSMLIPVLGEGMMGIMACQLLEESIEGIADWADGDRHAAKEHLVDVAQNLALLGLTAGVAKGLARVRPVDAVPAIEDLHPVTRADGETRLCKADLNGYERAVAFDPDVMPDARGQYEWQGKYYIRLAGKVYEQYYDRTLKRWRIRHPDDPQAYQPVLSHNGAGAWRHSLENPLTWNRLTLLRRMGHVSDTCSDAELLKIADISGVSDNALRKMHMDNLPPPPELAEALHLFDTDRNVAQVIEQLETGHAIDHRYLYIMPLIAELPGWPAGRTLEVFDASHLPGTSVKYGSERVRPDTPYKAPIRMTRSDILSGGLPARVLEALDESEINAMLGEAVAKNRPWRPQAFRDQIAAYAQTRRPALFESLYRDTETLDHWVDTLQRVSPGLSDFAAQDILNHADAGDLASLHATGRVPRKMLDEARWHAQRGRLTRALAGLHMEHMMPADTRRLALHTLSRLPGWTDEVRLEVREGSIAGRRLDSIGSETAALRNYVVKRGPVYQAFDEQGRSLNDVPLSGNNFYSSVMQAIPHETRQALGVAHSAGLQRAIVQYAKDHVSDIAAIMAPEGQGGRVFKPPERINARRLGYYASGEGAIGTAGVNPALMVRLLHLYPELKMSRANSILLELMSAGKSDADILQSFESLRSEWLQLEQTLEEWVSAGADLHQRNRVAVSLKESWRKKPVAQDHPAYRTLELVSAEPLPELSADLSHVTTLRLRSPGSTDLQMRRLLRNFPDLQYLDLSENRLIVNPIAPENAGRLLELDLRDNPLYRLDVSAMVRLEKLILKGTRLQTWPQGAESLRKLNWLDLRETGISTLPAAALARDDLMLNTNLTDAPLTADSRLQLQTAQQRCEVVLNLPEGALARFALEDVPEPDTRIFENGTLLASRLLPLPTELPGGEAVTRQLNGWIFSRRTGSALFGGRWTSSEARRDAALKIIECWKKGRMHETGHAAQILDLVNIAGLGALPRLSPEFAHVRELSLRGLGLNGADVHGFLSAFTELRSLDLGINDFHQLPQAVTAMERMESLGLSGNRFDDFSALAQDLGRLPQLKWLKLNYNRVRAFNGAALRGLPALRRLELSFNGMKQFEGPVGDSLEVLHLNGNDLRRWPDGVLQAERLATLNLTGNPIRDIPVEAFDGNHDRLLAGTHMSGTWRSLSSDSLMRLRAHLNRVRGERVLGISREVLEKWIADSRWDELGDSSSSESDR